MCNFGEAIIAVASVEGAICFGASVWTVFWRKISLLGNPENLVIDSVRARHQFVENYFYLSVEGFHAPLALH